MCEVLRDRVSGGGIVVGDRPDTDGLLARRLNWDFGLVLSGVTSEKDLPTNPEPDMVAADLRSLVEAYLEVDTS